jgi:3-methyl-2-oxobutanoate hydroxymethyltransferase
MAQAARKATEAVPVPTIGIGASAICDGQILVTDDMLGLFGGFTPRFVRRYADLSTIITQAAAEYGRDVVDRRFPGPEHSFGMRDIKPA